MARILSGTIVLTLLVVFVRTVAKWDGDLILETDKPHSLGAGLYLDPESNQTFVVMGRGNMNSEEKMEFGVKVVSPERTVSKFTLLDEEHNSFIGDIRGAEDGQHLFVTEVGTRERAHDICNVMHTAGCEEIYFRESLNGGKDWTDPQPIFRPNMSDGASRQSPSVLYIRESGRLYLFYYYITTELSAVGYVTRPPDSRVFSQEKLLFPSIFHSFGVSAAYTYLQGKAMLHLSWGERWGELWYSNSNDSMHWTPPIRLADGVDILQRFRYDGLLSNTRISKGTLYFTYITTETFAAQLIFSSDEGRTWSQPVQLSNKSTMMLRSAYCGTEGSQALFAVTLQYQRLIVVWYDIPNGRVVPLDAPFEQEGEFVIPIITCAQDRESRQFKVQVLATSSRGPMAYLTTTIVVPYNSTSLSHSLTV